MFFLTRQRACLPYSRGRPTWKGPCLHPWTITNSFAANAGDSPKHATYQAYESDFAPSTSLETLAGAEARVDDTATYLFYGAR